MIQVMCCAMGMQPEPVNPICHGLGLYCNASVGYCTLKLALAYGSNTDRGNSYIERYCKI